MSELNALKTGLYAARDFIREGEEQEYDELRASFLSQLEPEGSIEETFANEVIGAAWRLRRCRLIEADFSVSHSLDPMVDAVACGDQKSVDRARMQSHNLMRRSLAELRKLQTERVMRVNLGIPAHETPGLTDSKQIVHGLDLWDKHRLRHRKAEGLDTLEGLMAQADQQLCADTRQASANSFCKSEEPAATAEGLDALEGLVAQADQQLCADTRQASANSFCKSEEPAATAQDSRPGGSGRIPADAVPQDDFPCQPISFCKSDPQPVSHTLGDGCR